jgi:riboflavin kinase/FMN adenylyltransferase
MSIPVRHHLSDLPRRGVPLCLAAGFFDGVHKGHRQVIRAAVRRAAELHGACWILSFDNHPRKLIRPGSAPLMLTSSAHKVRLFGALGVDGCLLLPFTPDLAALSPRRFLERLAKAAPDWRMISVGEDWRFGKNGAGDAALLAAFCHPRGIEVEAVKPVRLRGEPVSSTRIREAIRRGAAGAAAALLGRPFSILGVVVKGGGLARGLGFPTANLAPQNEVRPADGVYACYARLEDGTLWPGVMNVGHRPTLQPVGGPDPAMEIHLIGFDRPIYGQELEIFFIARLRAERHFASVKRMAEQIRRDVREAARRLRPDKVKKACEECFTKGHGVGYSGPPKRRNEKRKKARGRSVHG